MPRGTKVGVLNRIAPGKIFMWDYATARGGFASERCARPGLLALEDLGAPRLERGGHDARPALGPRARAPRLTTASCSVRAQTSTVGPAPEIVAPSAPSAGARSQRARPTAGTGARGRAGAGGPAGRARRGPRSPRARPSASSAACRALTAASAQRDRRRAAPRAPPRSAPASRGTTSTASRPGGRLEARGAAVGARRRSRRAAPRRRCPGGPRARSREREQVGVELEEVVGGQQARRRIAAALEPRPPESGMSERDPEREAVGRVQRARSRARTRLRRSRAIAQVGLDREAPGLDDLELEVQRERRGERVEARPEVGRATRARGRARRALHLAEHRALDGGDSGSHGTTAPAWSSAVCGSLRPWPVSTQTIRPAPSAP